MKVEQIEVSKCSTGDIFAADVINKNGVILVAKDTVINDYIKDRLIELGIKSILIYSMSEDSSNGDIAYNEFKNNYKSTVLQTKKMLHELASGKPFDYQQVSFITEGIHKNINENYNIIKCLSEVRSIDEYTYAHCVNTAFYSMLIAKWLNLSNYEVEKAIQSGLLHDIGKSKIPNEILSKAGALSKEEYEVVKQHTILGYQMVEDINDLDADIKSAILLHHERIDGSGYPFHACSDSMSLFSKIVAVADVFDAMTSDRVYKKRKTPFQAFEMFQITGIGIFDSRILRVFMNNLSAYLIGLSVELSNMEIGEIVYIPLQNPTCPVVKASSSYIDLSQENRIQVLSMI